jgi:uncharacterized protein YbjQ (UPF0145 family)
MTRTDARTTGPFTCDLSVDEFLLVAGTGWEPVAFVAGEATFTPGHQASSRRRSKELTWVSDGLAHGHQLAIDKMRRQAVQAGGHGIVGVRLKTTDIEAGDRAASQLQHFSAVGTAIRRRNAESRQHPEPFTSHLSGQDTWVLLTAGYTPLGLVFGFSVYHAATDYNRLRDCCEMPVLTNALYGARERAMTRMQSQAAKLKAHGIVGVSIDTKIAPGPTVTFAAIGTAITASNATPDQTPIQIAVDLSRRRTESQRPTPR